MNNKCKYLRIRHKKGIVYKYCVIKKIQCPLNDNMCYSCNDKEYKEYKPMKKETSKQKKLEENRYSILTIRSSLKQLQTASTKHFKISFVRVFCLAFFCNSNIISCI